MDEKLIFSAAIPFIGTLVTLGVNAYFYRKIKNNVDSSLDKHRIMFTGVFNEKLIVYKEILNLYNVLYDLIESYSIYGKAALVTEVYKKNNIFLHYILINEPLISPELVKSLKVINSEIFEVFKHSKLYYDGVGTGLSTENLKSRSDSMDESLKKIDKNGSIHKSYENIIILIRDDMHLKNIKL